LSSTCIALLPETPIDIIGDIHGELSALTQLLTKLGYDHNGKHPEKRQLVFVGDLIDRGPDSPGVLRTVMRLVESGNAQCIAGNHELNAIRDQPKQYRSGEGWWYGRDESGYDSIIVDPEEKKRSFQPFLESLPCALEREDLRVIHACWHEPSIAKLRRASSVIEAFREEQVALKPKLEALGQELKTILRERGLKPDILKNPEKKVDFLPELARYDEENQMGNAVKVATSGIEGEADDSFFASGKWRMVRRIPWWEDYSGPPVVVGHYWRRYYPDSRTMAEKGEVDLFGMTPPQHLLGPDHNVMCIDYSVGMRFAERNGTANSPRSPGGAEFNGCLAALRVPEWELVFDDAREGLRVEPGQALS